MIKTGRGKYISVSNLAAFAENPARFARAKGGAYNSEAAKRGVAYHDSIGVNKGVKTLSIILLLTGVGLSCLALFYMR